MRQVALLRGINVAGQKKIKMDALRALFTELGYSEVESYIQSGNVCFESKKKEASLAKEIHAGIEDTFGFDVPIIIRTHKELTRLVEANPFFKASLTDDELKKLYLTFLAEAPKDTDGLDPAAYPGDEFRVVGREVYLRYGKGAGSTKLTNNVVEKKLGVPGTMRNWRTLNKLIELSA